MAKKMTLADLDRHATTTHIINRAIFADDAMRREDAFRFAGEERKLHEEAGRPFIVSDASRTLLVAMPGEPLRVPAEDGSLVDAEEQDFQRLIRSVW